MKLNCEKFIMEIIRLNERKEFTIRFLHMLNPLICLKVERMRKSYDHTYAGIFIKYGIFTDDLYKELDTSWSELCEKYKINLIPLVLMNPYFMVKAKWKSYKRKALELAGKREQFKLSIESKVANPETTIESFNRQFQPRFCSRRRGEA